MIPTPGPTRQVVLRPTHDSVRRHAREQARTRRAAKDMTQAGRRRAEQQAERDEAAHVKAECALREHPTLGRWLRQTPSGRLVLDRAKITAEARLVRPERARRDLSRKRGGSQARNEQGRDCKRLHGFCPILDGQHGGHGSVTMMQIHCHRGR